MSAPRCSGRSPVAQAACASRPCSLAQPKSQSTTPARRAAGQRRRRGRRQPRCVRAAAAPLADSAAAAPDSTLEADVCILGAGIIGLATALALLRADPHLRVALLDRQGPCAGATGAGQGYLWLAHRDVGSPLYRLAARSKEMWAQLLAPAVPELTREALEWQPLGSMLIASTRQESEELAARRERLAAEGLEARLLPAAEARALEPALALGSPDASALLVPSDLQLSGRAAAAALQRACQAHGGRFMPLFGEGAERLVGGQSGRVEAVDTQARRVAAPRGVVVALGAWTGCFLARQLADARWAAAVRPRRGLLLEVARPGGMPPLGRGLMEMGYTQHYSPAGRHPADAFAAYGGVLADKGAAAPGEREAAPGEEEAGQGEGGEAGITFTATTSAAGTLLVGSSREFAGYAADAPEPVVAAILERAALFLPGLAGLRRQDVGVRSGPRPYATAGSPIVGAVPGVEGLLVAAGHEGSGLTLAPATAALVADLLLGRPCGLEAEVVERLRCPFGLSIEDYLSM